MSAGLYAVVVRLRAGVGKAETNGRMAHAAFLRWIRERDPAMAEALHAGQASRPFTVALLPDPADARQTLLRCTLLDDALFAAFRRPLPVGGNTPAVRLGAASYDVLNITIEATPEGWSGQTTWSELTAGAGDAPEIMIKFATPTCFSRGAIDGRQVIDLFPQPGRVWESWARRWTQFAPLELAMNAPAITAAAGDWLLVADYDLRTSTVDFGRAKQKGFTGLVRYECRPHTPEDVRRQFHTLATFAFYSGTGYKTTMGLGVTQPGH